MPGHRHSPLGDISRIRQDLRDRYHDGFPILKELLQNADDAGARAPEDAAQQLMLVLARQGLTGAVHPLLRTAGLVVLNDGGFTFDDAVSITSIGMSNKTGQAGSAGKFGLGLKSVYHWAEAFFYFSSASFNNDSDRVSPYDLLNPWWSNESGDGRHGDWEKAWQQTREVNFRAFETLAQSLLGTKRWFGLWIPLRTTEHHRDEKGVVPSIENRLPEPNLDTLLGQDWVCRLAETLPLLRRLKTVRVGVLNGREYVEQARFDVEASAQRMRLGLPSKQTATQGRGPLTGTVRLSCGSQACSCPFVGLEQAEGNGILNSLKGHSLWPIQAALGPNGEDQQVPEKAEPHGAVVFTRQPANGRGTLRLQHAVFLPLGEPDEVSCDGGWRYCLYLHGFFFVDSGRRHIQPFDDLKDGFPPEQANSELEVIKLWNRTLLREVVAPLVLPSLDTLAKQEPMEPAEVESLVSAMRKSEMLKGILPWLCRQQRFVCRLQPGGAIWELETWDANHGQPGRWIELPQPGFAESELFALLPALKGLCGQAVVSLERKPCLANGKPQSPSDSELAGLLASVRATSFENAAHLDYLLELVPDKADELEPHSDLARALVNLANQLTSRLLPEDKDLAKQWKEFFKRLPLGAFVRLPIESPDARLQAALEGHNLPVALFWADWHEAEGKGKIPWSPLSLLLRRLGSLRLDEKLDLKQRSEIAIRLLSACEDQPQSWPAELARLPLFACRAADSTWVAVSHADLQAAQAEKRLFTRGNDWAANLAKAVPDLQTLLADQLLADALGLHATACAADTCVESLKRAARLATEFASRKPLFDQLLAEATPADPECWPALRCLLHGQVAEWDNQTTLFCEPQQTNAFVKLTRLALEAAGQSWRLIPHQIAGQLGLNDQQRRSLNLLDASKSTAEALVREVGPAKVDCTSLTTEECDTILLQFNDVKALRGLNIHETTDGRRVRISGHTYVDDGLFKDLPEQFKELVTRLRDHPGYGRFANADGSNQLVRRLSWEAVIEIPLSQSEPSQWHGTILAAIGQLGTLRAELRDRVRAVAWLPLTAGGAAKPADVLHLPGAEAELDGLPSEVLNGKIPILRLAESVQNHERFETFLKVILPPAKDVIVSLADLLKPHPAWSTGLAREWSADQVADWVTALGDAPPQALPITGLVKALHRNEETRELLPGFLQPLGGQISETAYAQVLTHLATRHRDADAKQRRELEDVFLRYLKAVDRVGADFAKNVLRTEGVLLQAASATWKSPAQLVWPAHGVAEDDQLLSAQADALSSLGNHEQALQQALHSDEAGEPYEAAAGQTPERLRRYFNSWIEFVPRETIGAFLCVLGNGPGLRELAEEFLGQNTIAGVRDEIATAATQPPQNQTLQEALANHRFACVLHEAQKVRRTSVLGEPVEVRRGSAKETIFLGSGITAFPCADEWTRRWLHLLCFDPAEMGGDPERLCGLLHASAEQILHYVFCQPGINLKPLWGRLGQPAQLHIRIAQNRVADAAQAFLRQVGAHRTPEVLEVLMQWDAADRRRAEAEEAGRSVPPEVQNRLAEAKTRLRQLLADHPNTQQATLAAVRAKMGNVYGYKPDSTPFEIWQNADDALVELDVLGYGTGRVAGIGLVGQRDAEGLSIAHWGRLVNEFQGSEGRQFRDRGFDEDLEKMVVQAISDKRAGEAQGQAVTGKFGLGFKSVFLVSDAPEVLSGSVDFVIRGGIYPVRLEAERREALVAVLKDLAPDHWRRGTLIRLPWRNDGQVNPDQVLGLFRRLAPLLVVFSRRLKRLRLFKPDTPDLEITWKPEPVADRIEVGALEHLHGDVRRALVLSHPVGNDRAQILFGLGPDGFVALPDDVPVFWVTAPTRAKPGYGFAVNGPFEPDVGRVQLALNSKRNEQLADELARGLAERLKALWQLAGQDWAATRSQLGLASTASSLGFWESLWQLVGRRFAEKCPKSDSNPVAALARRILWQSEHAGVRKFYSECAALPTGLWGEHQCLTRLADMHFEAAGALDREAVFLAASQWPAFRKRVHPARIVSASRVVSVLQRLGTLPQQPEMLRLATVVEWEVKHADEMRADPETAARLGQLVTLDFLKKLKDGKPEEREENEHKALTDLLPKVQFQAADGSWHKPAELVVSEGEGVDKDEQMRAAFAPPECRLNSHHTLSALQFFLACRPRLEANTEKMFDWMLSAKDDQTRAAAMRYLLNGDEALRHRLAKKAQEAIQAGEGGWLETAEEQPWFQEVCGEQEQEELAVHMLRTRRPEDLRSQPAQRPREEWSPQDLLVWWRDVQEHRKEYTLEGHNWHLLRPIGHNVDQANRIESLRRMLGNPDSDDGRELWYRLFGLACLMSEGRRTSELRDFWSGELEGDGKFWSATSQPLFREGADKVFDRLCDRRFTHVHATYERAYYWRRLFYDVRKMHRLVWECGFAAVLLERANTVRSGRELIEFIRSGHLPGQASWVGVVGQSVGSPLFFVLRELRRLGVIANPAVDSAAFFPCRPVRRAAASIGWLEESLVAVWKMEDLLRVSEILHEKVQPVPELHRDYDIPLLHMGVTCQPLPPPKPALQP